MCALKWSARAVGPDARDRYGGRGRLEISAAPPRTADVRFSDPRSGESKAISDLPLNGRNFTQLMVLMAGSTEPAGGTVAGHYVERAGGTAFSVNGHRQTANQFLIDGFMAKEVQHGTNSIEPIIDALQEFRVQTSNYTAEFGTEAGGQIDAVSRAAPTRSTERRGSSCATTSSTPTTSSTTAAAPRARRFGQSVRRRRRGRSSGTARSSSAPMKAPMCARASRS